MSPGVCLTLHRSTRRARVLVHAPDSTILIAGTGRTRSPRSGRLYKMQGKIIRKLSLHELEATGLPNETTTRPSRRLAGKLKSCLPNYTFMLPMEGGSLTTIRLLPTPSNWGLSKILPRYYSSERRNCRLYARRGTGSWGLSCQGIVKPEVCVRTLPPLTLSNRPGGAGLRGRAFQ